MPSAALPEAASASVVSSRTSRAAAGAVSPKAPVVKERSIGAVTALPSVLRIGSPSVPVDGVRERDRVARSRTRAARSGRDPPRGRPRRRRTSAATGAVPSSSSSEARQASTEARASGSSKRTRMRGRTETFDRAVARLERGDARAAEHVLAVGQAVVVAVGIERIEPRRDLGAVGEPVVVAVGVVRVACRGRLVAVAEPVAVVVEREVVRERVEAERDLLAVAESVAVEVVRGGEQLEHHLRDRERSSAGQFELCGDPQRRAAARPRASAP